LEHGVAAKEVGELTEGGDEGAGADVEDVLLSN
jgi:hypothetical protein